MKILVLTDSLAPDNKGGAGIVAANLSTKFANKGHQVYVITTTQSKSQVGKKRQQGLIVYKIYSHYHPRWRHYLSLYNSQTQPEIKNIIKKIRPDVVHAHNLHFYLSYNSLKIAASFTSNVFLTAHDAMLFHYGKLVEPFLSAQKRPPTSLMINPLRQLLTYKLTYNPLRNLVIKKYLKHVRKIICISHALEDALNQNKITNTTVIHNGIDINQWQVKTSQIKKFTDKHQLSKSKIIFFAGRVSQAKGIWQALKIIKAVSTIHPNTRLLIMGASSRQAKEINKKTSQLGITKYVKVLGWVSQNQLKQAYWASDIVLIPSIYLDPLTNIVLEAMACKRVVVATKFGGVSEVISPNKTGIIINPYQTQKAAQKISSLLLSDKKRQQIGQKAYQKVKKQFSLSKQASQYLRLFNQ